MAGDQPDQQTQLDGASVPAPGQPPAGAPNPAADVSYQPTEMAFPAQSAPPAPSTPPLGAGPATPAPGAPVGPYDPQAGGYGYPQVGQPAQPAPNAYPTPQPGYPSYAQPQPGFQQQATPAPGFQQQATPAPGFAYPGAPGAAAPTKQRNPVMMFGAIAGSVLAIGIVIGLIVLFSGPSPKPGPSGSGGSTGGGGTTTASGQLPTLWTAPKPASSTGDNRTLGVWFAGSVVVRGEASALTAYNLSDGKVAWTLPAPAGTKAFCSMSKDANKAGLGAVSFNLGDDDCSAIGAVDATTGTLKFKVGSPHPDHKSYDTQVTITDSSIAAASSGVLGAVSLTDGHQTWSYQERGDYCNDTSDTAGNVVVVSDYCADGSPKQQLQVLNADTGKPTTTIALPNENDRLSQIVSTDPMLVVQISADSDGDYLFGIDSSGHQMTKVPLKVTGEDKLRPSAASAPETKNVVIGNNLYIEVEQNNKTAIRAIDLTNGKVLWTSDGGAPEGLRLINKFSSVNAPQVLAIGGYSQPTQVGSLSLTDGSFKATATLNQKDNSLESFLDTEVRLADTGSVLVIDDLPIDHTAVMFGKS
jgi:hypothetical protein